MSATPDLATMPAYQRERRQSIVRAAREMLGERDLDLVQMRDIAARAGVAVGTLYRYFGSKDHLYAVVLGEWGRPREQDWFSSLAPAERFRARLHQWFSALGRHPEFYKIVRMMSSTDDPAAIAEASAIGQALTDALMQDLEGLPAEEAARISQIVWALHGDLLAQVTQQRIDLAECFRVVDTFADLVKLRLETASG